MFPSGNSSLYVAGNIGPNNANPVNDNWVMVREITDENGDTVGALSTKYRRATPLPALPVPITVDPVNTLEAVMLPTVGASQRLDCLGNWVPNRDAVDTRIINEYNTSRGIIPATENDVGGFPVIANGTPCPDSDHDGMPDAWEQAHRLNPNNAADGAQISSNGYTNLENYLNGI